jgi:hypothetical protein
MLYDKRSNKKRKSTRRLSIQEERMIKKVNCVKNDKGAWCKDRRVERSLSGMGARCCKVFDDDTCDYQVCFPRPVNSPSGFSRVRAGGKGR